jgi:hypothetical protein
LSTLHLVDGAVAAAWLTVESVYKAANLIWGVGRQGLPPAGRRPADVLFWLLLGAALTAPFWP